MRRRILAAALALLSKHGIGALTMEGIAAEAGVSKQTIYNWWPARGAVALDAITEYAHSVIEIPADGAVDEALTSFLTQTFAALTRPTRRILAGLMAEAQQDAELAVQLRKRLIEVRRAALKDILARAITRGELAPGSDLDFLADVVYGVMWYRLLVRHGPLDAPLAVQLARAVCALAPPGSGPAG